MQLLDEIVEARRLLNQKDIPVFAGNSNSYPGSAEEVMQLPSMAAATSNSDGYHTVRVGDTLDAFAPLTHLGL
jgi:hypothetical protein